MHMMLDMETFGTHPGAVIRSIGACIFDPFASAYGNAGTSSFYCNVSRASCEAFGLTVDPRTEAWWADQKPEAEAGLLTNQLSLEDALRGLEQFFHDTKAVEIWSYGANFDVVLIEEAMRAVTSYYRQRAPEGKDAAFVVVPPWSYKNVRCVRTVVAMAGIEASKYPRVGVFHNALDDARTQVNMLTTAFGRLRVSPSVNEMAQRDPKPAA